MGSTVCAMDMRLPIPGAPPAPPPPPQSGQVKRLTRRFISIALKEGASHYDILGVEITVTERDIKIAYRDIAALIHPDKCSEPNASEAFKKVSYGVQIKLCSSDYSRANDTGE